MKIIEDIQGQLNHYAESVARLSALHAAVEDLGLNEIDCSTSIDIFPYNYKTGEFGKRPVLTIVPLHNPGIGIFTDARGGIDMAVTDTTPLLSQIAKLILPKVGKLEKGFDDERNQITLTAKYQGVVIVLKDKTPATCSVETVEEEVDVPERVIAAHKEKKITYKLVGDCDPILADAAAHFETSEGAIPLFGRDAA